MNNIKIFVEWLIRCLASFISAVVVIFILRLTNLLTVPFSFALYFAIIDGTIWLIMSNIANKVKQLIEKE